MSSSPFLFILHLTHSRGRGLRFPDAPRPLQRLVSLPGHPQPHTGQTFTPSPFLQGGFRPLLQDAFSEMPAPTPPMPPAPVLCFTVHSRQSVPCELGLGFSLVSLSQLRGQMPAVQE